MELESEMGQRILEDHRGQVMMERKRRANDVPYKLALERVKDLPEGVHTTLDLDNTDAVINQRLCMAKVVNRDETKVMLWLQFNQGDYNSTFPLGVMGPPENESSFDGTYGLTMPNGMAADSVWADWTVDAIFEANGRPKGLIANLTPDNELTAAAGV